MDYKALDSSTVILRWVPPPLESHNGIIKYYIVRVSIEEKEISTSDEEIEVAVIVSLMPSFTYSFEVAAVTVAQGPFSDAINITLPEDGEQYLVHSAVVSTDKSAWLV